MQERFKKTAESFVPGSMTMPQEYYTSPEVFAKEQEKLFRNNWVYVGHVGNIPNSGDYIVADQTSDSLLVIRNKTGGVSSFFNICRHKGTLICNQEEGTLEKNVIQCDYHNWAYDSSDGHLIKAPRMEETPNFKKEEHGLHRAEVHIWEGFIFVYLGLDKAPPFEKSFPGLEGSLKDWNMADLRSYKKISYEIDANWKLMAENFNECYHCPTLHPALSRLIINDSGNNDFTEGEVLGGFLEFKPGVESITTTGKLAGLPLANLKKEDMNRGYYYSVGPTMLLNIHPDYVLVHRVVPRSPEKTTIISEWFFKPESFESPDFNPDTAVEFWDMTNWQDWKICERGQKGIRSMAYQPGPYSSRESLLAAYDRNYINRVDPYHQFIRK